MNRILFLIITWGLMVSSTIFAAVDFEKVGKRIWQNECAGTVSGLTSWNQGENFASLGIGHFIWYPRAEIKVFEESFPALLLFAKEQGVKTPAWLSQHAFNPWSSREVFLAVQESPELKELRQWLVDHLELQVRFIQRRLLNSFERMEGKALAHAKVLMKSSRGLFALMDYVNFKGEGFKLEERYQGEGWGLQQVLLLMKNATAEEFAQAAKKVLTRRVQLSPPERKEERWLPGWLKRCERYQDSF